MTNMSKDYYKILGISEACTTEEIKSAYRRLARIWHPDVAGNSAEAVNKFKEIAEAYEILSDKTKKAEYDTIKRFYNYSSANTSGKYRTQEERKSTTAPNNKKEHNVKKEHNTEAENKHSAGFNFAWDDIISKYKKYTDKFNNLNNNTKEEFKSEVKYRGVKRGNDINADVEITITEAINGAVKVINMLSTQVCQKCKGKKFINNNICPHCNGKGEISEHKRFTVKIPAGIKDYSKIRLSGEGEKGINGGRNGDLYITVHIKSPLDYRTEGNNILKKITIAPYQAVLGCNVNVKTLDGNVTVKISPNTQSGQKIKLNGCGIEANGKIGDMILTVEIQIPKTLSNQEIELYKKLEELASVLN